MVGAGVVVVVVVVVGAGVTVVVVGAGVVVVVLRQTPIALVSVPVRPLRLSTHIFSAKIPHVILLTEKQMVHLL